MLSTNSLGNLIMKDNMPMVQGVLCYETALSYHSLCTYPPHLINIKREGRVGIRTYLLSVFAEETLNLANTIEVNKGLYVTDVSRTICEMIKDDRDEHHLMEALYELQDSYPEDLDDMAKQYGVYEKLCALKEEAEEYFME